MKKQIIGLVMVVVVVDLAGYLYISSNNQDSTNQSQAESSSGQSSQNQTVQDSSREITLSEVEKHADQSDCWTVINDKVYDISSYVSRHPGGSEILRACGRDGSSLFNQRQTDSGEAVGSGTPHSSSARSQLSQLQIGALAQ